MDRDEPRPLETAEIERDGAVLRQVAAAFAARVVGQERLLETLLVTLVAGGHVLLESVPGLAKTTAAATLAAAVGGSFHRIQCTPDLLPSDILGTQVYDAGRAEFSTRLGPVHANVVLLDEINRSSAKTQSAMLEAMQEGQTSIAGEVHPLPSPFLVLATQNPIEQEGTYALPEAQLDRFLLKDVLDYPTAQQERDVVRRDAVPAPATPPAPVALADVERLRADAGRVHLDDAVLGYAVDLVRATRAPGEHLPAALARLVEFGASPRASIALVRSARALALVEGRAHVLPEDVRRLAHRVLRHRVVLGFEAVADDVRPDAVVDALLAAVPTP
ncbi:AAA family ATPase [Kineococcus rubinsiae]|uniref:AAA family ATPase n=1 Tax=Kineococcus rubinsiae TaxID=2609562 RepID=UPI0014322F70|nr:AAA family ATPase [Kineococcus rubinsiae]NIZ93724.1 AAA domain-containing protein [Kineococcus rubinsiae]